MESIVESMGSYVDFHSPKRRGSMSLETINQESFIHWNGPPVNLCKSLAEATLDLYFGSRKS